MLSAMCFSRQRLGFTASSAVKSVFPENSPASRRAGPCLEGQKQRDLVLKAGLAAR